MKRTCVFFPVTLWMSDRGETRRVQHNEALARDVLLENKRDRNDGAVILDFLVSSKIQTIHNVVESKVEALVKRHTWLIMDCCVPPFVFPAAPSSLLFAAFPFE